MPVLEYVEIGAVCSWTTCTDLQAVGRYTHSKFLTSVVRATGDLCGFLCQAAFTISHPLILQWT